MEKAVRDSDIINTATSVGDKESLFPYINDEWIKEGALICMPSAARFDEKFYLDENTKLVDVYKRQGLNWFYSKYLLNEADTESKYLVYAAFAKPSDAKNPLADMYYYSIHYYTDRVSQMSQEIGIDNRFKEHLSQYGNFWKNKHRIEKFKELGIDYYNAPVSYTHLDVYKRQQ